MNNRQAAAAVLGVLGVLLWLAQNRLPLPPPAPDDLAPRPAELFGFDSAVGNLGPVERPAKLRTAAICRSFAAALEYDGRQPTPICGYTSDVVTLFGTTNDYTWQGGNPLPADFRTETAAILARNLEPSGEPLEMDASRRSLAVDMMLAFAWCLEQ